MKTKLKYCILLFLLFMLQTFAQNEDKKWAITIGSGSVLYSQEDGSDIGFRYSTQFPRLSIGTFLTKSITIVGSISTSLDRFKEYTTIDGEIRYDFGTSQNRITPYVLLGGSLVDGKNLLPTVNFGAGGTLWVSDKIGLNGQLMYKFNEERFKSQRSHTFGSVGLVYLFSFSSKNKIIPDSRKKRIWNR